MCLRNLEREIRNPLEGYYGVTAKLDSLGKCITQFRKLSSNEKFLNNLDRIKDLRNKAMHGDHRFAPAAIKELLRTTLTIVAWTNNYDRS
mgnify:FL=1